MKTKFILLTSALFLVIMGAGCEKEKDNPNCYRGEILTLRERGHGGYNIVKITSVPPNGDLPEGVTIAFDREKIRKRLSIGSSIQFRINAYRKWVGPDTAEHLWPHYIGDIELCSN